MSLIFDHRHVLVLPDGSEQELEWSPKVREGDLVASDVLGITPEPGGKFIVSRIEELRQEEEAPYIVMYYLERF